MAVQTQIQARRGTAATWTSTNPTLAAGEMGFETDTGKFKIGTGSAAWTALGYAGGGQNTLSTYVYTATSGQTTFSGADSNGNTLSYTVGAIQVYLNGALLTPTSDFTASTGTSVVLVTGALTSDTLTVLALGSFTVSTDIAKSTLSTKGDILTATAASTPAVLAVGNSGEQIVANSAASTGLSYQGNQAAGKNFVINGGLDIWQRGTSFTGTSPYYSADRWNGARAGAVAGATWSQQTITGNLGTTPAQGVLYSLRVARDSGNTSTAVIQTANGFESANSIPLAGQTVVMSFYAKAGANFSSASNALAVKLATGTGINQNYLIAGFTGSAFAINTTATLTTSWQRFQYTATLPTTATEVALDFAYTPVGTAGAADNFEITGVQLEVGSVATQFARTGGTFQGELAACQRYYWQCIPASGTQQTIANGFYLNSSQARGTLAYPVTMRTAPTLTQTTGTSYFVFNNGSDDFINSLTLAFTNTNSTLVYNNTEVSGTAQTPGIFLSNNSLATLAFSSEL